jgi:hypothetical protein
MALMTKTKQSEFVTLTVEDLTRAIRNSIDKKGMADEEARQMAQHVMNFFGYSERIIDNILEPEDRDAFYMLEDSGLLTTEREETTLYDGREWRIHYWLFKKDRILQLARDPNSFRDPIVEEARSVYEEIPDDIWRVQEEVAASVAPWRVGAIVDIDSPYSCFVISPLASRILRTLRASSLSSCFSVLVIFVKSRLTGSRGSFFLTTQWHVLSPLVIMRLQANS